MRVFGTAPRLPRAAKAGSSTNMARFVDSVPVLLVPGRGLLVHGRRHELRRVGPGNEAGRAGARQRARLRRGVSTSPWTLGTRTSTFRYDVVEWQPPHRVVLAASNAVMRLRDEIVLDRIEVETLITYDARITLRGPLKVFDGWLERRFRPMGERAAAGLRARVQQPTLNESCVTRMTGAADSHWTESAGTADDGAVLAAHAARLQPELVALRRRLHRTPELGLDLPETHSTVLDALAGLELEVTTYDGFSGAAAVLHGTRPRAGGAAARRHGRACPSPRRRASTSPSTAPACTPVGTTCTWRCSWARRGCCTVVGQRSRDRSSSCSSPAKRDITAPGT